MSVECKRADQNQLLFSIGKQPILMRETSTIHNIEVVQLLDTQHKFTHLRTWSQLILVSVGASERMSVVLHDPFLDCPMQQIDMSKQQMQQILNCEEVPDPQKPL